MYDNSFENLTTLKDFHEIERKFREMMRNPIAKNEVWKFFDVFFSQMTNEEIVEHWWKLYRLFTELNWNRMRVSPSDSVATVLFGKQLVMACILKFEPIDELLWYLGTRFPDKTDCISEYTLIRKAVFESDMIVGKYKNEPQIVKNIVAEIVRLNQMGNQSLEIAEYKVKLETILFSELPDSNYIELLDINKREVVTTFFSFIHFLIGVEPEFIYGLVEENSYADQAVLEQTQNEINGENKEEEIMLPAQGVTTKNYFVEIKNKIQGDLESGKIEDQFEIFSILDQYSKEYNDPRILDFYYYDEQTGTFAWNDELLNGK